MGMSTIVLGGTSKLQDLQSVSNLLTACPFASSFAIPPYKSIKSICGGLFCLLLVWFFPHNSFPAMWIIMPRVKLNKCLERAVLLFKGKSSSICSIFNDNLIQIIKLSEKCSREYASVRNELQTGNNNTQSHFSVSFLVFLQLTLQQYPLFKSEIKALL